MSTNPDEIQQAIDAVTKPVTPIEVAIPGGPEVFRGNSPQELIDQLVASKAAANEAVRSARQEAHQTRTEMEQLRARTPAPTPSTNDAEKQDYYKTWAEDPEKAAALQMGRMLNVPPDRVKEVMQKAISTSVVNSAADEFLVRCPDFPRTPQTAELMQSALAAKYGNTMEAPTADNLEVVYHQLVREGRLRPNVMPIQGIQNENTVMPSIRGGSAPPNPVNEIMARAQDMPLADLKKVIDRLAAQQGGVR